MAKDNTIAISGVSGFIGSYLTTYFQQKGYRIIQLNRANFENHHKQQLGLLLAQASIVINLAGAPINKRWSTKYKKELRESRINSTNSLVSAVNSLKEPPKLFISASAVGYYSTLHSYDEYITRKGTNFLADLCDDWEKEAQKVSSKTRLVIARLGIVLAPEGGAFDTMSLSTKMRFSTIVGPGTQPLNWIDIEDVAQIIDTIIGDDKYVGVINFVAPNRIDNMEFTKKLAKHFNSRFTVKVPKLFFKIFFGEASQFMCEGQRVKPTKLLEGGYKFKTKTLEDFLNRVNLKD